MNSDLWEARLRRACADGDEAAAIEALDAGARPDPPDRVDEDSPLILAARHGRAEIIRTLVGRGAKIERRMRQGSRSHLGSRGPLGEAAWAGRLDAARELLRLGACPDAATPYEIGTDLEGHRPSTVEEFKRTHPEPPLRAALRGGRFEAASLLILAGARWDPEFLWHAGFQGWGASAGAWADSAGLLDARGLRLAIQSSASADCPEGVAWGLGRMGPEVPVPAEELSAAVACAATSPDSLALLARAGARYDPGCDGSIAGALAEAAMEGRVDSIHALMAMGADPNLPIRERDARGLPFLACFAGLRDGQAEAAQALIQAGADPFALDSEGRGAWEIMATAFNGAHDMPPGQVARRGAAMRWLFELALELGEPARPAMRAAAERLGQEVGQWPPGRGDPMAILGRELLAEARLTLARMDAELIGREAAPGDAEGAKAPRL